AGKYIHAEICSLLSIVKITMSRRLKNQVTSDAFQEIFSLIDESYDKAKGLSNSLYPALLEMVGLIKMFANQNKEQIKTKNVIIQFENSSPYFETIPFEYGEQL